MRLHCGSTSPYSQTCFLPFPPTGIPRELPNQSLQYESLSQRHFSRECHLQPLVTRTQPLRATTDMASPSTARKIRPALPCWESQIHPRPSDLPLPPQSLGKPPSAPGSFSTESHTHPPEHSSPLQSCSSQVLPGGIPISESSGPHLMPPSSLAHLVRLHHTPRTASKGDIPSVGA